MKGNPNYSDATIEDFVIMDEFDFEIRTRILKEILKIENKTKNQVFYVFIDAKIRHFLISYY